MKKFLSVILVMTLLVSMVPVDVQAATKPTVTKKLTITVGSKKTIKIKGKYIKSKKFKTNKKSVVTVNKKGKVTGKKAGKAKITVTVKYKKTKKAKKYTTRKYTCTVTVKDNAPIVTEKPQVTKEPVVTTPVVTPTPEVTTNPTVTEPVIPDATESPVIIPTQEPIINPETSDEPVVTTPEPNIPDVSDKPSVTETPNITPIITPTPQPTICWHENDETGVYCVVNNDLYPICKTCGEVMYYKGQLLDNPSISIYNKGDEITYSKWLTEPSETGGGILGIYKGVNVYDMTEEEIAEKYEKLDVVFEDGTTDIFYGKMIYCEDGSILRFELYAKSTTVLVKTIEYPSYEVVEIDLGNGETTKVYGYYDTVMANDVFNALNAYRVENGLAELETSEYMQSLADTRAPEAFYTYVYNLKDTENEYEAHERPDYTDCVTVAGDIGEYVYGENYLTCALISEEQASGLIVSVDYTTEQIMEWFKDSREHDANMLNTDYKYGAVSVFVGYPQNEDGSFRTYKDVIVLQSFHK